MCPLQKLPRQGEPMRPSGVSPSEACDPKPPVKSSLSPFLLDVLSIPNPVLGAAILQRKHYLFGTYWSWIWQGSRKDRDLDTTCPRRDSCISSCISLQVLQKEAAMTGSFSALLCCSLLPSQSAWDSYCCGAKLECSLQ